MSSSNKKTFKTSETSKQADATVTSDAILLDPTTTDHILVVTADSSANLTGQVDVELEMSPDGQNWCPAQIKSTTTTSGGTTTTDPIVGNEKAVNLEWDPAATAEYKNKFAKGRLEYNLSDGQEYNGLITDEVLRTDGVDFVHTRIATNKSFNYSGWFNSSTQPSTSYTPVLFRNGSLDTFENTQVIGLTDSVTQNLCEPAGLPVSTALLNSFTSGEGFSVSGWFRWNDADQATGYTSYIISMQGTTGYFSIGASSSGFLALEWGAGNFDNYIPSSTLGNNEWHHIAATVSKTSQKLYVDGNLVQTKSYILSNTDIDCTKGLTFFSDGNNNALQTNPASTDNFKLNGRGSNISVHSEFLDEYAIKQLYSNGHVRNAMNLPSIDSTKVEGFWQLNDSTTPEQDLSGNGRDLLFLGSLPAPVNENYLLGQSSATASGVALQDFRVTGSNLNLIPSLGYNSSTSTYDSTYLPKLDDAWSVSFWMKQDVTNNMDILQMYRANGVGFEVTTGIGVVSICYSSSLNNRVFNTISSPVDSQGNALTVTGTWLHVVIAKPALKPTDSGGITKIWINGVPQTVGQVSLSGSLNVTNFGSGAIANTRIFANQYSSGSGSVLARPAKILEMDDLAGWKKELTQTDVDIIYNNGQAIELTTTSIASDLDSYFKMGDGLSDDIPNNIVYDLKDSNKYIEKVGTGTHSVTSLTGNESFYSNGSVAGITNLSSTIILATGATLAEKQINGNAITLSLTKNFDLVNETWVTDASGEACFCLSFNGFEDQAEYFVLWKCNQIGKGVNFLDGNWHNVILSYRGRNDLLLSDDTSASFVQEGDLALFGPGLTAQNFVFNLSVDGQEYNDINSGRGLDYIGGLNVLDVSGDGFNIYNRHLKYTGNSQESYIPHTQGGATSVAISAGGIIAPALDEHNPWSFQGILDETSFHSQNFWQYSGGINANNFEYEYARTIYGNTVALSGTRGAGSTYDVGTPYPLNDPASIGATQGSSQYINPDRYDPSTNPHGGLEAWWRWGDTSGDCAENVNDVKDAADSIPSALITNHHLRAVEFGTDHLYTLVDGVDSTYVQNVVGGTTTTPGSSVTTFVSVVMDNIVDTACNVKDLALPILQYLRVKFTGSGSIDLGQGKAEASLWWKKRRTK